MKLINSFQKWHETKTGYAVFGLTELALGYLFALWAIDSGSLIDWFFTFMLFIGGIQNLAKLILKALPRGRKV